MPIPQVSKEVCGVVSLSLMTNDTIAATLEKIKTDNPVIYTMLYLLGRDYAETIRSSRDPADVSMSLCCISGVIVYELIRHQIEANDLRDLLEN